MKRYRGRMFGGSTPAKKKKRIVYDSDEDEPPPPPMPAQRAALKSKKKRSAPARKKKTFIPKIKKKHRFGFLTQTSLNKVLGDTFPNLTLQAGAKNNLANMMNDVMHNIATVASTFMQNANRQTLNERDIGAAVAQIYPNELGRHAQAEGLKALRKYAQRSNKKYNVEGYETKGGDARVRRLGSGLSHIGEDDEEQEFLPY